MRPPFRVEQEACGPYETAKRTVGDEAMKCSTPVAPIVQTTCEEPHSTQWKTASSTCLQTVNEMQEIADIMPYYKVSSLFTMKGENVDSRKRPMRTRREPTVTVSFRVDGRTMKRLESEAAQFNMSGGEYARKLVTDLLEDHRHAQLLDEANRTRKDIDELRGDIATVLEMILLNLTSATKEQMRAWISEHLRH